MGIGIKTGIIALAGAGSAFSNINSLAFDGSNDFLSGSSVFTPLNGETKASFSMWLKPTSDSTTLRTVFQVGRGATGADGQVTLFLFEGNRIDFNVNSSGTYGRGDISAITYGSWNHILITVDFAANPEFKCYVNGADETTGDNMGSLSVFPNATEPLYIGEFTTGHYSPFLGGIDEFAIWVGETLTATDASNIYNSGKPTDLSSYSTPPTHWWRMGDGDSFPTITDQVGSYNLTMTNMDSADIVEDVPS